MNTLKIISKLFAFMMLYESMVCGTLPSYEGKPRTHQFLHYEKVPVQGENGNTGPKLVQYYHSTTEYPTQVKPPPTQQQQQQQQPQPMNAIFTLLAPSDNYNPYLSESPTGPQVGMMRNHYDQVKDYGQDGRGGSHVIKLSFGEYQPNRDRGLPKNELKMLLLKLLVALLLENSKPPSSPIHQKSAEPRYMINEGIKYTATVSPTFGVKFSPLFSNLNTPSPSTGGYRTYQTQNPNGHEYSVYHGANGLEQLTFSRLKRRGDETESSSPTTTTSSSSSSSISTDISSNDKDEYTTADKRSVRKNRGEKEKRFDKEEFENEINKRGEYIYQSTPTY